LETHPEREELVKDAGGLEELLNGLDAVGGSVNGEILFPCLQPKALDQHEQAANMIEVQMGKEEVVKQVVIQTGGLEIAADRLAAIDEEGVLSEPIKEGGMIAFSRGPSIANSKTFK
jgi:hypothetical protein